MLLALKKENILDVQNISKTVELAKIYKQHCLSIFVKFFKKHKLRHWKVVRVKSNQPLTEEQLEVSSKNPRPYKVFETSNHILGTGTDIDGKSRWYFVTFFITQHGRQLKLSQ